MHIEFLVEDLSMKEALKNLLPKILREATTFEIHPFQGKTDLIKKLPNRLKGYKRWLLEDCRIVVLVDEDRENCKLLKDKLEAIAIDIGFITKTSTQLNENFQVLNRIAIEELESWFFGDIAAVVQAYPKVSSNLDTQAKYLKKAGGRRQEAGGSYVSP